MKRDTPLIFLWLTLALFAVVVWFSLIGGSYTARQCEILMSYADLSLEAVRASDFEGAKASLEALKIHWDNRRLFFAATQSHEDLDAVNAALLTAFFQLDDTCSDEFPAEIAEIKETIKKISEIQQLSIENIL